MHVGVRRCNRDAFKAMSGPVLWQNESQADREELMTYALKVFRTTIPHILASAAPH